MSERKPVNVKDYGAVGDGVTDDTKAVQDALLATASGIHFPPGTYPIGPPLNLDPLYGEEFFREMNAGREAYRRLAECIWKVVGPVQTVIDIGCGSGLVIEWMREHGATVQGIDLYGSSPVVPITRLNLEDVVDPGVPTAELVICTETAEHLPESAAENLVASCVQQAERIIVWSAAPPGQEGTGHINCQPPEYWLDKFEEWHWDWDDGLTIELRTAMRESHAQHEFCADNFWVLRWNRP